MKDDAEDGKAAVAGVLQDDEGRNRIGYAPSRRKAGPNSRMQGLVSFDRRAFGRADRTILSKLEGGSTGRE